MMSNYINTNGVMNWWYSNMFHLFCRYYSFCYTPFSCGNSWWPMGAECWMACVNLEFFTWCLLLNDLYILFKIMLESWRLLFDHLLFAWSSVLLTADSVWNIFFLERDEIRLGWTTIRTKKSLWEIILDCSVVVSDYIRFLWKWKIVENFKYN